MENEFIAGLDIGTTKIACLIGQRAEEGKIKILGYSVTNSVGVENGVVRNIGFTSESVKKAVEAAAMQANVKVREVYVGIAGQHIKSIPSQGSIIVPPEHSMITQQDVDRLIDEQNLIMLGPGEEIIHIFPQSYYVDNSILSNDIPPVGVPGKQLKADFHIVTGNSANIRNIIDSVRMAGYKVKDLVLEPIASSCAVLDSLSREAGVALVDIGGGTTDIAIFYDGIIRHTSVIALAGQAITNDIRRSCNILPNQAESLKVKYGSCLPTNERDGDVVAVPGIKNQAPREISLKTLANIIKTRVEQILEQVAYEIGTSGFDGKKLQAGLVLTGGGANMKYIKELASMITCMDTRIGYPNEHLLVDSDADLAHPKYATGVGLVLYGIEQEEQKRARQSASFAPIDNAESEKHVEEEIVDKPKVDPNDPFSVLDGIPQPPKSPEPPVEPPVVNPVINPVEETPTVNEKPKQPAPPKPQKPGIGSKIADWFGKIMDEEDE